MLEIENYLHAASLEEAYETLQTVKGATVLGGCGYLRLGARKIGTAIDLSQLQISGIQEVGETVEIGAMTTLRDVETSPIIRSLSNGLLSRSVENIVGVQLRNCVTLGGSVAGRYPFSDPITALMAMDAQLVFHHHGQISLQTYLEGKGLKDILVKIVLPKDDRYGAFQSIRKSATDYAVLNVAATRVENSFRVVVGSRPGKAMNVSEVTDYLAVEGLNEETAAQAGLLAAERLKFGDNPRGSGAYRKAICPVLVKRALLEILEEGCHAA